MNKNQADYLGRNTMAFRMGWDAFFANEDLPEEAHPDSPVGKEWQRGWNAAYFKQLRKTKSIERNRKEKVAA